MGRAEARFRHDSRLGECGIRPLRRHAPQHVPAFAGLPECALRNDFASAVLFRRTDDGRRGLCGKRSERSGRDLRGLGTAELPGITAMGAMGRYVSTPNRDFQPMNCTFGLLDGLLVDKQHKKIRNKQERYTVISERSLSYLRDWVTEMQV